MKTLLVIEDDDIDAEHIRNLVKKGEIYDEIEVIRVSLIEEGLEYLRTHKAISYVMLDMHLPDGDAKDFLLRFSAMNLAVKVFCMTSKIAPGFSKDDLVAIGAYSVVEKPEINPSWIRNAILLPKFDAQ